MQSTSGNSPFHGEGAHILEADFAKDPIPGMGTGAAQLWAGKQLLEERLSIPASSEQSMPFSGFFWPGGGLGAGSWAPIALEFVKITAKYILFLILCQAGIISGMGELLSDAREVWGTCVLTGVPHSIFPDPNIQSSAPCWMQPFPTQEPSPKSSCYLRIL